jgi:hypothetical protein
MPTIKYGILMLWAVLLPHEAVLLPHEAVLLPHEAVLLPHEAVLLPHEAVLLPHEAVLLPLVMGPCWAVHMRRPKNIKDLERCCMEEWSNIPPNVFFNPIKHYRTRLSAAIFARGGCTKY